MRYPTPIYQEKYRYFLERKTVSNCKDFVNFILLNPSTADENIDDPTIRSCLRITKNLGYQGMWVTNLFAFRATHPADLKKELDSIGSENNAYIKKYAKRSKLIIAAWGNHGSFLNRDKAVIKMLSSIKPLYCLGITTLGNPKHPLYVKRNTKLLKFISK